jgi:uncharacterized membrane protein YphA (DoxX/SURF4 family)
MRQGLSLIELSRLLIRGLLGAVFVFAGVSKLIDPESFAIIIGSFGLTPVSWVNPLSVILPLVELSAGWGMFFGARWALHLVICLTIGFIAVLTYGIRLGLDVDCGCFSVNDPEYRAFSTLHSALYRDLAMLAGIVYLYGINVFKKRMVKRNRMIIETIREKK